MNRRDQMLRAYINETAREPFRFGTMDCALWVGRWVDRVAGTTYADGWTHDDGTWREVVKREGGLDQLVTKRLGEPYGSVSDAQPGDVALVRLLSQRPLAIVGAGCVLIKTMSGVVDLDLRVAERAWKVRHAGR